MISEGYRQPFEGRNGLGYGLDIVHSEVDHFEVREGLDGAGESAEIHVAEVDSDF